MCGVCGFINRRMGENGNLPEADKDTAQPEGDSAKEGMAREQILEKMMEVIYHRGPDEGRHWMSETAALGFRRLSIIDLEKSSQPMLNEDGDKVLVFNGEIYNYKELREELLHAGHRFQTQGDSEVLLHGYEEWGERLPERLRGMFAFAIWDEKQQQLYAARDYFGIKPFFYTLCGDTFIFSSEIKGILPHPAYTKRLNREALEQYLSFQYSALEETFFKGIFQLKPGHFLKYKNGGKPETVRYFRPELKPEKMKKSTPQQEAEWTEKLDRAVAESVEAHMVADVEIGTFLSGGVDSALIAKEFSGSKAFTVGFDYGAQKFNEIPLAKELAEEMKLEHRGKEITEQEFWEAVPKVLYHLDEPSGDPSAVALYFVAREAAKKVKVVVSGEGADEFFGGYRIYCEPNSLRRYQLLPGFLRRWIGSAARRLPRMKGRSFLIRGSLPVEKRFIGNANLFSQAEREKLLKQPAGAASPQELLAGDYEDTKGLDDASRMQYVDLLHWLPGDILQKADRMSMAHSLESRVPYLDREVFETARRLPAGYKQKGQISKYMFREMARRHLPEASAERKKLGFPVPLETFLSSPEGTKMLDKAFSSPAAEEYFHKEALEELRRGCGSGRGNTNRKIWAVYAFLTWYQVYFSENFDFGLTKS